jgi:hypothetical protein
MKTKTVLGVIAAALVAACTSTSTPRWDTSAFPNQPVYGEAPAATVALEAAK